MKAQKFTLLMVDDDENDRFFLQTTFQTLDARYRVQGLSSGNDAIAYLKGEGRFDDRDKFQFPSYIITDLKMPRVDGFELLKWLREHKEFSRIPVIVITGSSLNTDEEDLVIAHANAFLSKDIVFQQPQKFIEAVQKFVAH